MNISDFTEPTVEEKVQPVEVAVSVEKKKKTVSFSQYAMWLKCPYQWKLSYVDKLSKFDETVNTVFGKSMHTILQAYLSMLYKDGAAQADGQDWITKFNEEFDKELAKMRASGNARKEITDTEVEEYRQDGKNILDYFLSYANRSKHFPSKKFEVVGVELPLAIPLKAGNIIYKGFLDIVLKDKSTGKIHILDFKTSTFGWNKYQKVDRTKIDQLVLYKRFYNQFFKVAMDSIEVEFIVLKRKLLEDVEYPQQRIQRISPPDGKMSVKMVEESFLEFINECFDPHGEYNAATHFLKNPGKAKKNCKYCPFKDMVDAAGNKVCDGKEG